MNGTLSRDGDRYVLRFERHYPHPPEKVWRAITDPAELKHWFPSSIEGERVQGAKLRFLFEGAFEGATEGTMRVYDPPRVLEYSWDEDILRFELVPDGKGCKLIFTDSFTERSKAARDASGWHSCLDQLAAVITGEQPDAATRASWANLYGEYLSQLGLGAFPSFIGGAELATGDAFAIPGVRGERFAAARGVRLATLCASRDAEVPEHGTEQDGYLLVIEGSFVLRMAGQDIALPPGAEFHIPGGLRVGARVKAGTRWIHATGAKPS